MDKTNPIPITYHAALDRAAAEFMELMPSQPPRSLVDVSPGGAWRCDKSVVFGAPAKWSLSIKPTTNSAHAVRFADWWQEAGGRTKTGDDARWLELHQYRDGWECLAFEHRERAASKIIGKGEGSLPLAITVACLRALGVEVSDE